MNFELNTYKNKRTKTEYIMEHRCSYCNSIFVSVVVGIPKTTEKICKGCLLKMIEKIDNTIIGKLTSKPLFKN